MSDSFDPMQRRRLTLKRGRERAVANRHPWIFAGAIGGESGPDDAAIADLVDAHGNVVASGFHSRHSQIRLRALTFDGETLDAGVVRARIARAIARRAPLLRDGTNAVRLVHAEGDELSGLVIDRYDDVAVVEIANAGLDRIRDLVVDVLRSELAPRAIFFKNDIPARKLERLSMEPEVLGSSGSSVPRVPRGETPRNRGTREPDEAEEPEEPEEPRNGGTEDLATGILENGLRFRVDPAKGQKTGFFLDQRDNRAIVRDVARGRRMLNLFSYSGAFGVYAVAGGAASVENVDVSAPAIAAARLNHELNGSADNVHFTVADAFAFVRGCRETFDLIVCDPPAFAKSRGEVDRAARGYKDVNLFAMKLAAPGALMLTFSCSGHISLDLFQKVIFAAAFDAGRRIAFVRRLTAGADHPVSLYCPEGEYLKGFLLEVRE